MTVVSMTSSRPEPVDADVVGGAQGGNPRCLFFELVVLSGVELKTRGRETRKPTKATDIGPQLDGARIRRRNEQQHQ